MAYSITWNENHCLVNFSGDINIRDIELANKYVHGDKRIYKLPASIWDFTKCSSINIQAEELHYTTVADLGSTKDINKHKLALVTSDSAATEVFQTYIKKSGEYGSPWEIEIFNTLGSADKWIIA